MFVINDCAVFLLPWAASLIILRQVPAPFPLLSFFNSLTSLQYQKLTDINSRKIITIATGVLRAGISGRHTAITLRFQGSSPRSRYPEVWSGGFMCFRKVLKSNIPNYVH